VLELIENELASAYGQRKNNKPCRFLLNPDRNFFILSTASPP
jgi:hypothetical protein